MSQSEKKAKRAIATSMTERDTAGSSSSSQPLTKKGKNKKKATSAGSHLTSTAPSNSPVIFAHKPVESKRRVGVFWDIENCSVPSGRSTIELVSRIRALIEKNNLIENEFVVVCDTSKCPKEVIEDLNDCQVTIIHVTSTSKNAADDKLKQCIQRFVDLFDSLGITSALLLISGDINFAPVLNDARTRKETFIILLHRPPSRSALLSCANLSIDFYEFAKDLQYRYKYLPGDPILHVTNLPKTKCVNEIRKRLLQLSNNCGGKSVFVCNDRSEAFIKFGCWDDAKRAQPRIDQEDVFGSKVNVQQTNLDSEDSDSSLASNCSKEKQVNLHDSAKAELANIPCRGDQSREFNSSKRTDAYTTAPQRRSETDVYSSSFESKKPKSVDEAKNAANKWLRPLAVSKPLDNCKYTPTSCGVKNGELNLSNSYVQLRINNLDPSLDCNRLKRIIGKKFEEKKINYTEIRVYEAPTAGDSSLAVTAKATVKFPTQKDAQLAILRLQHEKIGHTKIIITKVYKGTDLDVLRDEVISTFENIPHDNFVPLVLFQELFEKRFYKAIGLNELCKLRNIVEVTSEENGKKGQFVQLVFKNSGNVGNKTEHTAALNQLCSLHCPQTVDGVCAEQVTHESLPYVKISLHMLSQQIHHLLDSHGGVLQLNSIVQCYFAEFNENFNTQELPLIPLEHLISCVTGVQIISSGVNKQVIWQKNRDDETCSNDSSFSNSDYDDLTKQLVQFSKEVKEMLKSYPRTIIPLTKFRPAYYKYFGRQCCVNKYGFLKLINLLEAIPQIVQILNDHQTRLITLTHSEQIKRFASDLIKVIKAQPGKRIKLSCFAEEFKKIFERTFNIADYGVCYIDDMLKENWKFVEIIDTEDDDKLISIPRKEQTQEEVIRTKAFSKEVVELLRTTPTFEVNFNKFIPIYHHYFNKQCRVGEYGFSKLIELFEAISPETVEIVLNSQNDKLIRLSYQKRLEAIGSRFEHILKSSLSKCYPLKSLSTSYRTAFGCNINFELFNSNDLIDLLSKIPGSWFRLTKKNNKLYITLIDNNEIDNSKKNAPEVKQNVKILKREVQNSKGKLTVVTHLKNKDDALMQMTEVGDLLCGFEIPDNLPPPELTPTKVNQEPDIPILDSDLIRFSPTESLTTSVGDSIDLMFSLNEDIDTLENPMTPKVETPTQELIFNGTKKQKKRIAANFSMDS